MMAYTGRLRSKSRRGTQQIFERGGSVPKSSPYPSRKRSTFVTDSYFTVTLYDSAGFQQFKGYKVLSKVCEKSTICQ